MKLLMNISRYYKISIKEIYQKYAGLMDCKITIQKTRHYMKENTFK